MRAVVAPCSTSRRSTASSLQGAGLVVLCNPLDPGGRVFERDELVALSEIVERRVTAAQTQPA